jgi:uncharacterized protein (TIGR00106 family)
MFVIVDFTVIPIGVGVSLSRYIAECQRILNESGLNYQMHANGTNVEGEWDQVFITIRRCHERLHEIGVPRISTSIKVGTRTDRQTRMEDKLISVRRKLE